MEFDKRMTKFANILRKRAENDWDSVCAITGGEGTGKSTLTIEIAMIADKNFSMDQSMLFQPKAKEVHEKLMNLPKYSAIIADEAIRILYKHDWQSSGQKYLNKVFALARKENQMVFLCIPRFHDLNEYFRNWRVKFWIHVYQRGKAVVLIADKNPFIKDPFHLKENLKMLYKSASGRMIDESVIVNVFKKMPNYHTHFDFPDMDDELKTKYVALKNKYAYEGLSLGEEEDVHKTRYLHLSTFCSRVLHIPYVTLARITEEKPGNNHQRISEHWNGIAEELRTRWYICRRDIMRARTIEKEVKEALKSLRKKANTLVVSENIQKANDVGEKDED